MIEYNGLSLTNPITYA